MTNKLKLSASAAALALLIAGGATSVKAADVVDDPGCTLSGAVGIGYMYTWTEASFDSDENIGDKDEFDGNFNTPFGEAGGLITCGAWNVQADFAYYDHTAEVDDGDKDIDVNASNSHFGGAVFWRDPSFASVGIHASAVNQDTFGIIDSDFYRFGVFGEWYAGDMFTIGGAVHYSEGTIIEDDDGDLDRSAWEFTANARFYVTPDFSLMVQGDYYTADIDANTSFPGPTDVDMDEDGWAITGEAEYLVWDQGLSIFAGARYAERTFEFEIGNGVESDSFDIDVDDTQVYAGIKFYFGSDGTLIERQRTGLTDNTSTVFEKLPAFLNALTAVEDDL